MNELGFSNKFDAAMAFAEMAKGCVVRNAQDYQALANRINEIRELENELAAEYAAHPVVIAAKVLQKKKGELAELLETARKTSKQKLFTYDDEQEKARREAEAKLAAELKAKAEADALALAQAAEDAGDKEGADAILEQEISTHAPVVVIPRSVPKVPGHTRRMIKKWKYKNENKLGVKPEFLTPDETKISGIVRSMGSAAEGLVGGIIVYEVAA